MTSVPRGRGTSEVDVGNVSAHGFWLLVGGRERFVSFKDFPWFRDATIGQLTNVELPSPHHLYWPELDIDLHLESLDHPERYPLVSRMQPQVRAQMVVSRVGEAPPAYKLRRKRPRGTRGRTQA